MNIQFIKKDDLIMAAIYNKMRIEKLQRVQQILSDTAAGTLHGVYDKDF